MADKNKSNTNGTPCYDSGRGLPTTATSTPMPQVKPPKPAESTKKS